MPGQNVNFEDYVPPARFDGIPWTDARIREALTPGGTRTLIDTVSLGTVDPDPANPAPRSFTTNAGTAPDRWYDVIFVDGAGNVSEPTLPFQNISTGAAGDPVCQDWISGDDILDCCSTDLGTDLPLDTFATEAVALLFELTGRVFTGICTRTVRPCPGSCACWPPGRAVQGSGWMYRRGCRPLSTVKLAGYPVRSISEVTIDGTVVDPSEYQLDKGRDLVRLNDADGRRQFWPGCQDLGQASGNDTFFVTYTHGTEPPVAAVEAAKQLGCELAKVCPTSGVDEGDCALPIGTVELVRQGITVRAQTLGLFLTQGQTGLAHVDAFLAVYAPRARPPAVLWSPDVAPYAQKA